MHLYRWHIQDFPQEGANVPRGDFSGKMYVKIREFRPVGGVRTRYKWL